MIWTRSWPGGRGARSRATPACAGAGSDPALRPDDAASRPDLTGPWLGAQEGGGRQLPGRTVRGSVQRDGARVQGVRQDPDSAARRDRRQQAAVGRARAGQGAAGRLPGASAARAHRAAATAEQPRGAGSAVEGAGPTPRCGRGAGLIATAASLVFRYVTKLPPAEPATIAAWLRWGFEGSGDLPRCLRKCLHRDRRVAAPGPSE